MTLGSTESTTTSVSGDRETRSLVRYSALIPGDDKQRRRERKGGGKRENQTSGRRKEILIEMCVRVKARQHEGRNVKKKKIKNKVNANEIKKEKKGGTSDLGI